MKTLILSSIILSLYSCDYFSSEKVNERVETEVAISKYEMTKNYAKTKTTFNLKYQKVLENSKDTMVTKSLQKFYSVLLETINYTDSLRTEMNKYEKANVTDATTFRKIFLKDAIGDTLFNKIKLTYTLAEVVSLTDERKSEIKKSRANILNEPNEEQRKNQYFGLNGALGISMILYGFEMELLNIGIESLDDYKNV